ncbi:hypothetical protein MTR_4g037080 [Medicago truncatula]|uniref:Uncharacterized protein n=1 Tax=Medicago truncatula TaxID=3880 RepID=G7JSF4_MEDTR|nr:hypothetical protein MTR_4g037080 [Medicago truncatula]
MIFGTGFPVFRFSKLYLEEVSLEDIVGTIIDNNAEDDDKDDTVSLESVTRKEALMASNSSQLYDTIQKYNT